MKWFSALMTAVILAVLFVPAPAVPDVGVTGIDIVVHLLLFGLWGAAVAWEFRARVHQVAVAALAFAFATEVMQTFAVGRTFAWSDIAADLVGAVLGAAVAARFHRTRRPTGAGAP